MPKAAVIGNPTRDGGMVLGGASTVKADHRQAARKGDPAVSPQLGMGQVATASKTVWAGGAQMARGGIDTALHPSPSQAGAAVPPVLDAKTATALRAALEQAVKDIHDKKARHVKIVNDKKGRTPDDLVKEDGKAEKAWSIQLDDFDGDGNVDSVKAEGALAQIGGQRALTFGQGGVGIEGSASIFSGGASGTLTANQQAAAIEAAILKSRAGFFVQGASNASNFAKGGISLNVGELGANASTKLNLLKGGIGGGMGADASLGSIVADGTVSAAVFDISNYVPGGQLIGLVAGNALNAGKDQAFRTAANLVRRFGGTDLAKRIEAAKDWTLQVKGSLTAGLSAPEGEMKLEGGYDERAGRVNVKNTGKVGEGFKFGYEIEISLGKPTETPIEVPKPKPGAGVVGLEEVTETIIVGP